MIKSVATRADDIFGTRTAGGTGNPRATKVTDRPPEEWIAIPVPALVTEETFARVRQRLVDNKNFAARNTKVPSLLQGLSACSTCGYAYYRTSTPTTNKKIYYYRCLGSVAYRYEDGRVCTSTPVRNRLPRRRGLGPRHRTPRRPHHHPRRDRPAPGTGPHL
jgi:hypothetical protein